MIDTIISFDEMKEKAQKFYLGLGYPIRDDDSLELAVQSLTMPCYANEHNLKFGENIGNNSALATIGDSYWGAYVLTIAFCIYKDKGKLSSTVKKNLCCNKKMNELGREWLEPYLFATNNDIKDSNSEDENNKGYATAMEAVIGYLYLDFHDDVLRTLIQQFPRPKLFPKGENTFSDEKPN